MDVTVDVVLSSSLNNALSALDVHILEREVPDVIVSFVTPGEPDSLAYLVG